MYDTIFRYIPFRKSTRRDEELDALTRLLYHSSSREQKKVIKKAIDGSIEKQKEIIRRAEMTK